MILAYAEIHVFLLQSVNDYINLNVECIDPFLCTVGRECDIDYI